MQWSFDRGFLNYVNKTETSLFETVFDAVNQTYKKQGSWQFIQNNPRLWHQLVRQALPDTEYSSRPFPPPSQNSPQQKANDWHKRPQPPRDRDRDRGRDRQGPAKQHFDNERPNKRPELSGQRPPQQAEFFLRFSLFDANKVHLHGAPENFSDIKTKPINYDGKIVGYLGLVVRKELSNANELQFSEQLNNTFGLIALGTLLIVAGLAFPLANHFVRPIKKLKESTQVLASGHYKFRIKHQANDELGELSRDFNLLAKTLEDNENARHRWIADISHELRTPLAILRGEIEAIIDGVRQANTQSMTSLHQEVIQLTRLVNDLYELSLSDIGALNYRIKDIDINELLATSIASFEDSFNKKQIKVKQNISKDKLIFKGDKARLQQLFSNLLKNSLKYTDANGSINIELIAEANNLILNFQDSSPGVSAQDIPKLFDRLFRVESSRNRKLGGAGLGLAIVKNIVEAHQGSIAAKLSPLGGLWIMINLPRT
jgi:two-component system sensor histidine kinase BaeS